MYSLPTEPHKIKERIRRYERAFKKDELEYGFIRDGYGKRYLLGLLYLLLNDIEGAYESYKWFEETFPDDAGEPLCYLCWTLTLYRKNKCDKASDKLIQTMLQNLYLIPHLLGLNPEKYDIWHGSNYHDMEYIDYLLPIITNLCTQEELEWMGERYNSNKFKALRERYVELDHQLITEPRGPKRTELVDQQYKLKRLDFSDLKY